MGYPETLGIADGGTITITRPSSAPPAGGGGGGGAPSAEDFKNIVITSNINAGDTTVKTEILRNSSSQVSNPPPGLVYKNLNIMVGTSGFAVPKNIKGAVIKFRVDNSWIESNNLDDTDVRMIKWDGSKWIKLETTKKDKDGKYTYYEAQTNAFSTFAITGLKGESNPTTVPLPSVTSPETTPEITGTRVIVITPEELPETTFVRI
ncbi:MAG: PGF-pre-PGF domain-containing protein [Candidatus Methanoperedens sp.]|nr:PGF-pre-PGF domain-containing protein [Candidatus Methanoperedens sp.]